MHILSPDRNGADFSQKSNAFANTITETQRKAPKTWVPSAETLQNLLEQYISNPKSLSSFKQLLLAEEIEKAQEQLNSQVPPPLLHRPPKRGLEQSAVTTPDLKRQRRENHCAYVEENYSRLLSNETTNVREEMFEKTRSLGSSLKQLRPPPPLLKQTDTDKNGWETRTCNPQDHYTFTRERNTPNNEWSGSKDNIGYTKSTSAWANATRNTRVRGHNSEQTEPRKSKRLSPDGKPEPLPREIEGDCKSSCGGYAFDHTAMPKIIAVHSISKSAEDEDEWERNKAFISKVKAKQNRPGVPVEAGQIISQTSRLHSISKSFSEEKKKESYAQDHHGYKGTDQSAVSTERNNTSEEVSFERYVLYHLLSRFQGNVEQVKRVLKQNLLQEWLSYCQGNVNPRLQTFNGVNFYELRKLYEIWRQLQGNSKTNQAQGNTVEPISSTQDPKADRVQKLGDANSLQNQPSGFRNLQTSPNSQNVQTAYSRPNQRNRSPKNASNVNEITPQSTVLSSSRTSSDFQQQVDNGGVGGTLIENGSMNKHPMNIQEKIGILSQKSSSGPICHDPSSSPAVLLSPNTTSTPPGGFLEQSSFNQISPRATPVNVSTFNSNQQTLKSDMCQGSNIIKCMPRDQSIQRDHSAQEHVVRNHYAASERSQSKIVVQEQERADGTNISSVTLLHISQTNSKPIQNQMLSSLKLAPSPLASTCQSDIRANLNVPSVQSQHTMKQANHLESRNKDAVRGQETKANYLWRFKGGKLISDSMPGINDGEPIPDAEMHNLISGQRKTTEKVHWEANSESHTSGPKSYYKASASAPSSLNDQSWDMQTLEQQHKKVCGAAASGKRCYCVLQPKGPAKGGQQSTTQNGNPIHSIQQMIDRTDKLSTDAVRALSIRSQGTNIKVQDCRNISTTPTTQAKQQCHVIVNNSQNTQGTRQYHAGLQVQCTQQYGGLSNSRVTQGTQQFQTHRLQVPSTQSYAGLSNSPNVQASQQVNANFINSSRTQANHQTYANHRIYSKAQANEQSNTGLNVYNHTQASEQSIVRHNISSNSQVNQPSNVDPNILSSLQANHQLYGIHKIHKNELVKQSSNSSINTQENQSYTSFNFSSNSQGIKPSSTGFNYSSNTETNEQPNTWLKRSSHAHEMQQTSASLETRGSSISPNISRVTQPTQQSRVSLRTSSYVQETQQSSASLRDSQNATENHQTKTSLKNLLCAQPNQQSNTSLHISTNAQVYQQSNQPQNSSHALHLSSNVRANQQSNAGIKTSRAAQLNQQPNANLPISRNAQISQQSHAAQTNQQSNASLQHISRNAQEDQQSHRRFHVPRNAQQVDQQSNANVKSLLTAKANEQSSPSFSASRNATASQQSNPSFSVLRKAQANQQKNSSPETLLKALASQPSNARLQLTQQSANTLVRIAPKVETTTTQIPKTTLPTNLQRTGSKKPESPVVVKSEKVKEKQCYFPAPVTPKKQYTSLQQLAKKVIETRERYETENIPWKKKILKSLEGVLMKRLRKIERETGEEADLDDVEKATDREANITGENNKK